MASESRDDAGVSVDLPAEVAEWLDEEAAALGVERSRFLAELLAAHRDATDGGLDEALDEAVADAADDAVDERLADSLSDAVAESDLADLRSEFQEKIQDVRERVIQVKREADAKAPADHDHEEVADVVDDLTGLADDVDGLEREVADLRERLTERVDDQNEDLDAFDDRLGDVEDKLRRVAWVVSDLKEETSGRDAHERAVERIKRAAAQEGVSTADCERCGEAVHVALLTDPECPHCQATVADVRPDGGFFRTKARLVPAAQLESGEPADGED